MNLAQTLRLRTIDCLLEHYGYINRSVLTDYFGISIPQASLDIQEYLKLCPGNMLYCKSTRRYLRSESFKRSLP